jgi:hypothetical protein
LSSLRVFVRRHLRVRYMNVDPSKFLIYIKKISIQLKNQPWVVVFCSTDKIVP